MKCLDRLKCLLKPRILTLRAEDAVAAEGWIRFPLASGTPLDAFSLIEVRDEQGELLMWTTEYAGTPGLRDEVAFTLTAN